MRLDRVRYYIMAITEQDIDNVDYKFQSAKPDNLIVVFNDPEENNAHSDVRMPKYQVIVRNKVAATSESLARLVEAKTKEQNKLQVYYGMQLTASMIGTGSSVIFAPDDGSGNTKAAQFAVADYVLIDEEVLKVTGVSSPNVTASRAQLGTDIAVHSNDDPVYNISHDPIPGVKSNSINSVNPAFTDMEEDTKNRYEFSVNYSARCVL